MTLNLRLSLASLLRRVITQRFLKFGTVGVSGIMVNQGVLYAAQEYLFQVPHVQDEVDWIRLNLSLAMAIFFATLNNFFWNRMWTWADRMHRYGKPWPAQFGQYMLACWLSIALQMLLTNLMAPFFYIYIANLIAIVLTSVLNFILNDIWTFGRMNLMSHARHRPDPSA